MNETTASIMTAMAPYPTGRASAAGPGLGRAVWSVVFVLGLCLLLVVHDRAFALSAGGETSLDTDLAASVGGSSSARQISFLVLGAFGGVLLLRKSAETVAPDRLLLLSIVAFSVWIALSPLWSDDAMLSAKRTAIPLLSIVAGLGIGKLLVPRQLCQAVVVLSGAFVCLGVVNECLYGTFLRGGDYRFSGTMHANRQAVNCAALTLASLALLLQSRAAGLPNKRLWGALLVGLLFLFLTKSRTSLAATLLGGMALVYLASNRGKRLAILATGFVLASGIGLLWLADAAGGLGYAARLGRDEEQADISTLTGRIPIWEAVLEDIASRPLVGYGCGGFWTQGRVEYYSYIHEWEFNHAHSAYLETMTGVGAIGLLLGMLMVAVGLRQGMRAYAQNQDACYLFIVALLAMGLVHGFADSNFVSAGYAPILVISALASLVFHHPPGPGSDSFLRSVEVTR